MIHARRKRRVDRPNRHASHNAARVRVSGDDLRVVVIAFDAVVLVPAAVVQRGRVAGCSDGQVAAVDVEAIERVADLRRMHVQSGVVGSAVQARRPKGIAVQMRLAV